MSSFQRVRRGTTWIRKPLTVSQALASVAGAGALLLAGASMVPAEFAQFALFNLAFNLITGLVRAGLYTPSLIALRKLPTAHVPTRYALLAAVATSLAMLATIWALGVRTPRDLALVAGSAGVAAGFDWLYNRAVAQGHRWDAAVSNLLRVLLVAAAALVPEIRSDSVWLQTVLSVSLVVPMGYLLWRLPRVREWLSYRHYAGPAGWQLLDFGLGQSLNVIPLLVLGATSANGPVAGMRLAQALLGPLNLAFAAASANLVADGSTRPEYAEATAVIAGGTRIGRALSLMAFVLVGLLVGVVWATGFELRGVGNDSLVLGLGLVGLSLLTTGWANIHAIVLRILDLQARVTIGRFVIALLTCTGFVVGYLAGGTTTSLVAGFLTLTVVSPAVFISMAAAKYRQLR